MTLLEAEGISVRFGALSALDDVTITVGPGRLVGLIGPNGAGKTTFVDAVTGFTPSRGTVRFDGRDMTDLPPHRRARAGVARTWQSVELFDDLTIAENLSALAHRPSALDFVRPGRARDDAAAQQALAAMGVEDLADRMPGDLSHGQRTLAGVARALVTSPALVCMDEPAAGLDTAESSRLGHRIRTIADLGTAVLLIDHDMSLVLAVCDEIYVVDFGRVIAHGPPDEIRTDPRVIEAYLGTTAGVEA